MAINSLHFEDIDKPYPETKLANITFKMMRFLYPPYGKEPLIITFDVISPEPNKINIILSMAIFLGLLLGFFSFKNIYKHRKALALKKKQLEEQEKDELAIAGPAIYRNDWLPESSESEACYEDENMAATIKQGNRNNDGYIEDINHNLLGLNAGDENYMETQIVIGKPPQHPRCDCKM